MSVFRKVKENTYTFEDVAIDFFKINSELEKIPLDAQIIFDSEIQALKNNCSRILELMDLTNRRITFIGSILEHNIVLNAENSELTFRNVNGGSFKTNIKLKTIGVSRSLLFENLTNIDIELISLDTNILEIRNIKNANLFIGKVNSTSICLSEISKSNLRIATIKAKKLEVGYYGLICATQFGLIAPPVSVQTVPVSESGFGSICASFLNQISVRFVPHSG